MSSRNSSAPPAANEGRHENAAARPLSLLTSVPGEALSADQARALNIARSLVQAGLPVFVARRDGSKPLGFALPSGWQHTQPRLDAIDSWRPGDALCALMGVVCDGIDVDPVNAGHEDALRAARAFPHSFGRSRTPSGGTHDLIARTHMRSTDATVTGIDVKAGDDGTDPRGGRGQGRGFLFIPPTERASKVTGELRQYIWEIEPDLTGIEEWEEAPELEALADLMRAKRSRAATASDRNSTTFHPSTAYDPHVGHIPAGERHKRLLSYAGRLRARGLTLTEAEVLLKRRWQDCEQPPDHPYSLADAQAVLDDVFGRYPSGIVDEPPALVAQDRPKGISTSGSSWSPVDLSGLLDGTLAPLEPTLLPRDDGRCLLYRGRVHSLHGESESGKSMVAQIEAARLLRAGERVVYVDYESTPDVVVGRLMLMGVEREAVRQHLDYLRPQSPPASDRQNWESLLARPATLIVLDGVTEALATEGRSILDNDEITAWMRDVPRALAHRTGAAVVLVDHVTKSSEGRGRFAIGAQAKMASLDGASYSVEVVEPLGRGLRGVLRLWVGKDREGAVRPHSGRFNSSDRTQHAATVNISSTSDGISADLVAPSRGLEEERPASNQSALMERLSRALEAAHGPLSTNDLTEGNAQVGGNKRGKKEALRLLVEQGYVLASPGPRRATLHTTIRPYRQPSPGRDAQS